MVEDVGAFGDGEGGAHLVEHVGLGFAGRGGGVRGGKGSWREGGGWICGAGLKSWKGAW